MSDFFGFRFTPPHVWFRDFVKLVSKIYLIDRQPFKMFAI